MRLIELLQAASDWHDDQATIYVARPWSCDADAVLIAPAPDTTEPQDQGGTSYSYFLETVTAREFIEDYTASEEGASATERELCERLIRYADDDA